MERKNNFNPTPTQWVLGRNFKDEKWCLDIFSHYDKDSKRLYHCVGTNYFHCIPYEGNEHLRGTTDDYKESWQPKVGLKEGESCYIVSFSNLGKAYSMEVPWMDYPSQQKLLKKGWLTKTREECDEIVKKLNKAIENIC